MSQLPFDSGAVLVVDKPLNWTSFDVVKKIRYEICKHYSLKKIKVGHAGTLDPLATGIVVICTGKKTKTIDQLINESKQYIGEIRLGSTTPSFDLETKIDNELKQISENFLGKLNQIPPLYSAKKINGKRAYQYARNNETLELKPSKVTIYSISLKIINKNTISFNCHCSKGTYIRSLARDIGLFLKSGGHLISLRRIKSGNFTMEMAKSIDEWIDIIKTS
jgi:tRNA pseudouridine55 synthase